MLIVESGTGLNLDANTYVTLSGIDDASANAYFEALGDTRWTSTSVTNTMKEQAILKGMRYIESLPWKGIKTSATQPLQWPRSGVYDSDDRLLEDDFIPQAVKDALCEASVRSLTGTNPLQPDLARGGKKDAEQIGPMSIAYSKTASSRTAFTVIDDLLKGLLKSRLMREIIRS